MSDKISDLQLIEVATSGGRMLVAYELRRSRRARYLRLCVDRGSHARLTVPWTCSFEEARTFLRCQGDWLAKQLARSGERTSLLDYLQRKPHLSARGHSLPLEIVSTRFRPEYIYALEPPAITLKVAMSLAVEDALKKLLRAFAAETLILRVYDLAHAHKLEVKRVSVRDQSTRWGSCSSSGTLSLNWRLILLSPNLLDHIIYHELAHLREMNHSERFWERLRTFDQRTDSHNRRLSAASARIMSLGR